MLETHGFSGRRQPFIPENDIPGQRFVLVTLGYGKPVFFIEIFHFQSARKDKFRIADLFLRKVGHIVLVFDFAENLLQNILQRDNTGRTAELVITTAILLL